MKVTKLLIKRDRWARSMKDGNYGDSMLLNEQNNMCCLGFLGKACGLRKKDLFDAGYPSETPSKTKWVVGILNRFENDSRWTKTAVSINDNGHITEPTRERKLTNHFKKIGIQLSFK